MAHEDDDDDDLLGPRGGDGRPLSPNDNGGPTEGKKRGRPRAAGQEAAKELRNGIERIERLEEERAATGNDIKEVYAELKGRGFDTKAVRKIIAERKQDADALMEFESILDVYRHALGMI